MERNEIIKKVAKMIAEGKGKEIEDALALVEEDSITDECDENEDWLSDEEDEEYDDEQIITPLTDAIRSVSYMAEPVNGAIPVLPIPTVYGTVILVDLRKYQYGTEKIRAVLPSDFNFLPIRIEEIKYENGLTSEAIVYKPKMEDDIVELGIVFTSQIINCNYGYVLPIDGMYASYGAIATDLVDMANAIKSLVHTVTESHNMIVLPNKGVKVTKGDATCKGKDYEIGVFYKFDGELIPHKQGLHYTTEAEALKTWYRNDYTENIPWVVQSGPNMISKNKVCVTDGLIFLKELTWDKVDEVIED